MTEAKLTNNRQSLPVIAVITAVILSLLSLALYSRTLHPGVGPSLDSMELQIAALVDGVIHPPGSPQYLLLGKLAMQILPGPSAAYRLNLMSALSAAAAIGFVYLLGYRLTRSLVASGFGALSLAIAVRFWYQASIAELYTLNAFYVALVVYLLVSWQQTGQKAAYWAAVMAYALSFGNHLSMILLLPAFLLTVWLTDRSMLLKPANLLLTILIVVLAALQYLSIPLRVAADPPFCNFCPSNAALPSYLTGGPFKAQMFTLPRREVLARLPDAIGQWNLQFMPWGYALGIIGLWELFQRKSKLAWVLAAGMLAEYIFVMGYDIPDWHDFLTPVYVIFAPLVAYGALKIWELTAPPISRLLPEREKLSRVGYSTALAGAGLLALLVVGYVNLGQVDQSADTTYELNGKTLLAQAEPGAWLLMPPPQSTAFYYTWAIRYLSYVDGRYLDDSPPWLTVVTPAEVSPPPGPEPYYLDWADAAPQLTAEALRESQRQVFVVDSRDTRIADLGLLPVCRSGGEVIAGYEVVAVRDGTTVVPLVAPEVWESAAPYTVFDGAPAVCPD